MSAIAAAEIPLSLYLHFPWCVAKCPYCDFNSHALRGELPEDAYCEALLRDLDFELQDAETRPLRSIFMGGGTPSLFSDRALDRLLRALQTRLSFAADIEITLEANPGTADAGHFVGYRAAGINRLSMGVQSLDDAQLKRLGRIHDRAAVFQAYEQARQAGFDNINLDLMYALPEQSLDAARSDLQELIALAPEHLSYYQLTLEPNTEFARQPPPLPDNDAAWTMQEQGEALLAAAGYAQYEVSAYAQPGRQARHNLNYWTFGDYLGIGAGAHGKRSGPDVVRRRARHKLPRTYLAHAGSAQAIQDERVIPAPDLPLEFLMNALRLNEGFDQRDYRERTGLTWGAHPGTALALSRGLLTDVAGRIRTTDTGRRHLNGVLQLFLE